MLLASMSHAAPDRDAAQARADRQFFWKVFRTRPARLDGPLREENISDIEVREIEAVMREHFPGAIINIAGVVVGCPCADGPACDSQVWVVAHKANRNDGLMLSRIDNSWAIGPLQQWWMRYDRIRSLMRAALASGDPDRLEIYSSLQERQNQLQQEFPVCVEEKKNES